MKMFYLNKKLLLHKNKIRTRVFFLVMLVLLMSFLVKAPGHSVGLQEKVLDRQGRSLILSSKSRSDSLIEKVGLLGTRARFLKMNQKSQLLTGDLIKEFKNYRVNKNNILFDSEKYILNLLTSDEKIVQKIGDYLNDHSELEKLSEGVSVVKNKPDVVLNRISAIDLLENIMRQEVNSVKSEEAKSLLSSIILQEESGQKNSSDQFARLVRAEKFDAMVAIARADFELSVELIKKTQDPKLRETLKKALAAGWVDSGLSREKTVSLVERQFDPSK